MVKIKIKNTDEGMFETRKYEADAVLLVTKEGNDANICIQGVIGETDTAVCLARLVADATKAAELDRSEACVFATTVGIIAMDMIREDRECQ